MKAFRVYDANFSYLGSYDCFEIACDAAIMDYWKKTGNPDPDYYIVSDDSMTKYDAR